MSKRRSLLSTVLASLQTTDPLQQDGHVTDHSNITAVPTLDRTEDSSSMDMLGTTQEPDDSSDIVEKALQLSLPLLPLVVAAFCFLYRYIYVSRDLRLARRPGNSNPSSDADPSPSAREGEGGGGGGLGDRYPGVTSGLGSTVVGVTGATFAAVGGVGASSFTAKGAGAPSGHFGFDATKDTNFQSIFAQYSSSASFSNFHNT